ncbi:MAG: redoxin domain-containing protein, partial [Luteibacter sp.]
MTFAARLALIAVITLLPLGAAGFTTEAPEVSSGALGTEGTMPSIGGATGWLNSPPLTTKGLRGKVVLVDFWTFSCINSLRPLPYLRAWSAKYEAQGLVVIGVQSPEFAFEQNEENVRKALADHGLAFPIAIDNGHRVWNAFHNVYWPAIYLVDAEGRIRFHHFGEGDYDMTERAIQQLLAEAKATGIDHRLVSVDGQGAEAAPDWDNLKTPETYLGYAQAERFVSPGGAVENARHTYRAPSPIALNDWGLVGDWTMGAETTTLKKEDGEIVFRFHARDVHLVMGAS